MKRYPMFIYLYKHSFRYEKYFHRTIISLPLMRNSIFPWLVCCWLRHNINQFPSDVRCNWQSAAAKKLTRARKTFKRSRFKKKNQSMCGKSKLQRSERIYGRKIAPRATIKFQSNEKKFSISSHLFSNAKLNINFRSGLFCCAMKKDYTIYRSWRLTENWMGNDSFLGQILI